MSTLFKRMTSKACSNSEPLRSRIIGRMSEASEQLGSESFRRNKAVPKHKRSPSPLYAGGRDTSTEKRFRNPFAKGKRG